MDLNDEIAKVAYGLFERDGRQDGRDQEHWLEAEKIVRAKLTEQKPKPSPKVTPSKKAAVKGDVAVKKKERAAKSGEAIVTSQSKKASRTPRSK